jgi:hypothetical protein
MKKTRTWIAKMNEEDIRFSLSQCIENELQYLVLEEGCDLDTVVDEAEKILQKLREEFNKVLSSAEEPVDDEEELDEPESSSENTEHLA